MKDAGIGRQKWQGRESWNKIDQTLGQPPSRALKIKYLCLQVNDVLKPKKPRKDDLTAKSAVENAAVNMDPEHSIMFMKNTRTKERGLIFSNFVGQTGTLDSEL